MIYTVSNQRGQPLCAWNWAQGKLAAREETEPQEAKVLLALGVCHVEMQSSRLIVVVGTNHVRFWRHEGGRLRGKRGSSTNELGTHCCVCFADDGVTFTGTDRGELWLWHATQHVKTLQLHAGPIYDVSISVELQQLATAGHDGVVHIVGWDMEPVANFVAKEHANGLVTAAHEGRVTALTSLDWKSEQDKMLVATSDAEIFEFMYTSAGHVDEVLAVTHGHAASVSALCAHPRRPMAVTAAEDGTVCIWDMTQETHLLATAHVRKGAAPTSLDFAPHEANIIALGLSDGNIQVWDVSWMIESAHVHSREEQHRTPTQPTSKRKRPITCIRYSPCGKMLAAGTQDGYIDVYNVNRGYEMVGTCKGHFGSLTDLDWDADSAHLASNSSSSELLFWDLPTCVPNKRPHTLRDCEWSSGTCRFSWAVLASVPSDTATLSGVCRQKGAVRDCFAACYEGGMVKLFRYGQAQGLSRNYNGGAGRMSHVAFAHDGSFLITAGGADASILLWRCNYVKQLPTSSYHIDLIISKPLSPASVRGSLTTDDSVAQTPSRRRRRKYAEEEAVRHVAPYLQNVSALMLHRAPQTYGAFGYAGFVSIYVHNMSECERLDAAL
jgi:WD40 repeat protein